MKEMCVDCGKPTEDIEMHGDGRWRCVPCKLKKLGRAPRQYTEKEVQTKFLSQVWNIIRYWFNESRRPGTLEKMEGLAFSLLVMLDGGSMGMPGFIVAPASHPDDPEYSKEHGEDWYPTNEDAEVDCDIAVELHDNFDKHKPKDWPAAQEPERKAIPPDAITRLDTNALMMIFGLVGRIQGAADRISFTVWPSLRLRAKNASYKYHSGMFGDVKMMVATMAGRVMVTMEGGGSSFTVIGAESDERGVCGPHAIKGSANDALGLVETVAKNWDPDKLKRDDSLSIAPM